MPMLPAGCGYEGYDFGASYPDSKCYGGRLYDLDNCDGEILYEPSDYIPCPECNHEAWRDSFKEQIEMEGYLSAEAGQPKEDCPYPNTALKYPQDGEWLKECWLRGYDALLAERNKQNEK